MADGGSTTQALPSESVVIQNQLLSVPGGASEPSLLARLGEVAMAVDNGISNPDIEQLCMPDNPEDVCAPAEDSKMKNALDQKTEFPKEEPTKNVEDSVNAKVEEPEEHSIQEGQAASVVIESLPVGVELAHAATASEDGANDQSSTTNLPATIAREMKQTVEEEGERSGVVQERPGGLDTTTIGDGTTSSEEEHHTHVDSSAINESREHPAKEGGAINESATDEEGEPASSPQEKRFNASTCLVVREEEGEEQQEEEANGKDGQFHNSMSEGCSGNVDTTSDVSSISVLPDSPVECLLLAQVVATETFQPLARSFVASTLGSCVTAGCSTSVNDFVADPQPAIVLLPEDGDIQLLFGEKIAAAAAVSHPRLQSCYHHKEEWT